MSGPRISDHALLRFLERAGGLDVEGVRASLSSGLARAHTAALVIGGGDHLIVVDRTTYVVRNGTVTTVVDAKSPAKHFADLRGGPRP